MADNNKNNGMSPRKTQDYDQDGLISEREIELEIKLDKSVTQSGIAKYALAAIIVMAAYLVSPWGPDTARLMALDGTLSTYFIAMASIVGAYMGFTAWMSRK